MALLCLPVISWLSSGSVGIWNFFIGLLLPFQGTTLFIASLALSSIAIYMLASVLGRMGGILLIVIGVIGLVFSLGTTIILIAIGAFMVFLGSAGKMLVMLNVLIFFLSYACYGF